MRLSVLYVIFVYWSKVEVTCRCCLFRISCLDKLKFFCLPVSLCFLCFVSLPGLIFPRDGNLWFCAKQGLSERWRSLSCCNVYLTHSPTAEIYEMRSHKFTMSRSDRWLRNDGLLSLQIDCARRVCSKARKECLRLIKKLNWNKGMCTIGKKLSVIAGLAQFNCLLNVCNYFRDCHTKS